jgi:hypothetical protein
MYQEMGTISLHPYYHTPKIYGGRVGLKATFIVGTMERVKTY